MMFEENLQNQKHSVVKETICIRLGRHRKISHAKKDSRRSFLPVSFEYRGSFQGPPQSWQLHRSNHQKAKSNMLKQADCIKFLLYIQYK